ncbi:Helicase conserved C-terminal domain-containing protein [Planococcus glaciei]|uniref:DEAD/DEAH box helicase n=1 Tax=Planococcus glaciei TaxID=459472 RepID=UPI000892365B|nr:DEAD/DEAH box helicase [Planococcus glaciei]SDI11642.1 Helicase conserved C-terminal domain-containing protein [Planococcus glaciei]
MSIHPLHGKNRIDNDYRDYLATTFPINDEEIEAAFSKELRKENLLSKGPFLEVTPPYKKGASISDLVREGILSKEFLTLNQEEMPAERPLYTHQEKAIRKAKEKKNFVVATGTGSGKTESFMMPILNDLFFEDEHKGLRPGVRALFVYPMNALANDQMKRLRSLLKNTPEITFGRYTGETEQLESKALDKFKQQNPGIEKLPNEILSRNEMRNNPPHILVTNYAMLEYLLLRPTDTAFFDGPFSNEWKFIVLDEVHSYNGANGIEIGMLLRRLKDRVLKKRPYRGSLQCIATSATLGSGAEAKQKVLEFAGNIFDEPFYFKSEKVNDLIESERIDYRDEHELLHRPDWTVYSYLLELKQKDRLNDNDILKLNDFGIENANSLLTNERKTNEFLYDFLSGDENLFNLRDLLKNKPQDLNALLYRLIALQAKYGEVKAEEVHQGLINLVDIAGSISAKDSQEPLLPARYHVFVRAIEGCYLKLYPNYEVSLQAKKVDEKTNHPFFEMGVCSNCGQVHLIGEEEDGKLMQRKQSQTQDEKITYTAYMIKEHDQKLAVDEDEDDLTEEDKETYEMCPCCASIWQKGDDSSSCCREREITYPKLVTLVKEPIKFSGHSSCNHCGKKKQNPIKLFVSGNDGPAAILTTSLYQQLVLDSKKIIKNENVTVGNDLFGDLFNDVLSDEEVKEVTENKYEPQKLLVFSDSRQEAAFFAPYLEYTYERDLWRAILYKTIGKYDEKEPISLKTWALDAYSEALKWDVYTPEMDREERKTVAEEYVMSEFIKGNVRISLEGTGLVSYQLDIPDQIESNLEVLAQRLNFDNGQELKVALQVLLSTLRHKNAVTHLERSKFNSDRMKPINFENSVNKNAADNKGYVSAWIPKRSNIRLDYLKKIFIRKGLNENAAINAAQEQLLKIWDLINLPLFYESFFKSKNGNNLLRQSIWRVRKNLPIFQCNACKIITTYNVKNVCMTNGCSGLLNSIKSDSLKSHYINQYNNLIPVKMSVKEHTAQLSPENASHYQEKFVNGDINVLSCSTTFEMGVDVGGLEAVFLRNVPPETANYIQRAGRAGRRKASVAFVLTFAQRKSHDLTYYQDPENIIAGVIKPPVLKMNNSKIIKRHLNSLVLSSFFRENEELFGKVSDFFQDSMTIKSGPKRIDHYIKNMPTHLLESVQKVVPNYGQLQYHPEFISWEKDLMLEETSLFNKVSKLYYQDLEELKKIKEEDFKASRNTDRLNRVMNRIQNEGLISFLSSSNIIPKYGFPVDVVEMVISQTEKDDIRLSRDLSMAIGEYAPGSQIVANGTIYESTGIRKVKGFELPTLYYIECNNCKSYKVIERLNPNYRVITAQCETCEEICEVHKMIIPKFGFNAKRLEKASDRKPARENRSRVFFSEYFYSEEQEVREHQQASEQERTFNLKGQELRIKYSPYGKLSVISKGRSGQGYKICTLCGSMMSTKDSKHRNQMNKICEGTIDKKSIHLGHEFISDILEVEFINSTPEPELWDSLLYAFLNGISISLGINRRDIDGCIKYNHLATPTIVLFDKVPGGAGYMNEVFGQLEKVIQAAKELVSSCQCGKETSCYGCLKDYSNQYCHDTLSRGMVEEYLSKLVK